MDVPSGLYRWTKTEIHAACSTDYNAYRAAKTARAKAYFAAHPELKDPGHEYKAKDIAAALPPGHEGLADLIPTGLRHTHHLSGNSSQVLALALLGAARRLDPSHEWLWQGFGTLPGPRSMPPSSGLEVELDAVTLGEDAKRVTSVDYLVKDDGLVMCIECKWSEEGMGACSCANAGGNPSEGKCRPAVLNSRPIYWQTAYEVFGLPERQDGRACPLSPVYQAVRNVAAALALRPAGGLAVFGLIYDDQNPYFGVSGRVGGEPRAGAAA